MIEGGSSKNINSYKKSAYQTPVQNDKTSLGMNNNGSTSAKN